MTSIVECLAAQAERHPNRPALVSDWGELTFDELLDLTLRMAAWLRDRGIGPGDHVALLCSNRPAFLVAWFALANRGAVAVTLNTGLVGEGLRYSVRQSDARAVLIERAILDEKRQDLEPVLANLSVLDFAGEDDLFEAMRAVEPEEVRVAHDAEPCTIIYTSGTTGLPKGVLNSHRAYIACGERMVRLLELTPDDRIMVFLPLFHTNPQMYAVMSMLVCGCSLAIRPRFSVTRFFDDARRFDCTTFTYVGTVLAMLAARGPREDRGHRLRGGVGGGAPRDVWRAIEDRFGIVVHELYGMTEVGGWVSGNSVGDRRFGSCGPLRDDVDVAVFDSDDRPVPPGTRGEIVVRPREPYVILSGYHNNPGAAWNSSRNFWFHTGDLGSIDEDGYLYFHGRIKEIIRRGGENISPVEIETLLLDHPDIKDAAIVGVPDAIFGEELKAVVVPGRPLDPAEVRRFLEGRIPAFMLPRYVEFVTLIPKTETQKIQRHLLKDAGGPLHDLGGAHAAS